MQQHPILKDLSDSQLLTEVNRLTQSERAAIASLVAALAELDARRLYLGLGCSSMFTYCTRVLHLAEHSAFNRIEAARAARRFPIHHVIPYAEGGLTTAENLELRCAAHNRCEAEQWFQLFVRETPPPYAGSRSLVRASAERYISSS